MSKLTCCVTGAIAALLLVASTAAAATHTAEYFGTFYGGGFDDEQSAPAATGLSEVAAVQASNSSDYVLLADGQVWAFGSGGAGQLGDGSTANTETPVRVRIPESVKIVSIGQARNEGIAISSTGAVYGWGEDSDGSLCLKGGKRKRPGGASKTLDTPVEIASLYGDSVIAESGGGAHTLWLMADGHVLACGNQDSSGLGESAPAPGSTPTEIPGLSNVVQISGSGASAALTSSGEVFAWGPNGHGQVGIGSSAETVFTPTHVKLPEAATEVATGGDNGANGSSAAILKSGALYSWGDDKHGQLGNGNTNGSSTPVDTGLSYANVVVGGEVTLGLTATGELQSFGNPAHGMLGDPSHGSGLSPGLVASGVTGMSSVAEQSLIDVQ
jgi:alpha-tubulin suppressor-like RCC1 family protein